LNEYRKNGIVSSDDAFVIAINGMDIGFLILNPSPIPLIVTSLFPIGEMRLTINTQKLEVTNRELTYRDGVIKYSGNQVSTKPFLNPEHSGISGVLYSEVPFGKIPQKSGSEFLFIHNRHAKIKMNKGWIKNGRDYWLGYNTLEIASFL